MFRPLLFGLLLAAPALAGCFTSESEDSPAGGAGAGPDPGSSVRTPRADAPSLGKRWHFHNYWGTSDNLTLFEGPVTLAVEPSLAGSALRVGAGTFAPASGRIVPPETGRIQIEVSWNGSLAPRPVALYYRAANASEFFEAGPAWPEPANVSVREEMADAPHTGGSGWAFRLEAAPDEHGLALANGTVYVRAVAWLGRPIIIDPPHRDGWAGRDVLPLAHGRFEGRAWRTPQGVAVQNGTDARTQESLLALVPPNGTTVPEGAGSILVRLEWTSSLAAIPAATPQFVVRFSEGNTLTSGVAAREEADGSSATYRILVDSKSVDSPYSARSTWRIDVDLGETTPTFDGSIAAHAWVMKSEDGPAPA